jgi:hypothetical protein
MKNIEILDKRIIEHDGMFAPEGYTINGESFSPSFIQQRAKELGFVNGYRWGVEYATNGKKPDLADDVFVKYQHKTDGKWLNNPFPVNGLAWEETSKAFKITDQRYKPEDTSYLDKPERCGLEAPENLNHKCSSSDIIVRFGDDNAADWYDYDTLKMKGFPKSGTMVIGLTEPVLSVFQCVFVGFDGDGSIVIEAENGSLCRYRESNLKFRPFGWNRKAEAEKKRVVDAAIDAMKPNPLTGTMEKWFGKLYDAGYLRLPANKD